MYMYKDSILILQLQYVQQMTSLQLYLIISKDYKQLNLNTKYLQLENFN